MHDRRRFISRIALALLLVFPALCFAQNHHMLVADDEFLRALDGRIPAEFDRVPISRLNAEALLEKLNSNGSMIWIGAADHVPADLGVGAFRPSREALQVSVAVHSPLPVEIHCGKTSLASAWLKPPKELPYHNIDEEQRAEFLPVLEAFDPYGKIVGYPGVLMRYSPSFVKRRFGGAECFFFFFDKPAEAMDARNWSSLLEAIATRWRGGLDIERLESGYASYSPGERVRLRARLRNRTSDAAASEIRFLVRGPGELRFREIDRHRRIADGHGESEAVSDFLAGSKPGVWFVKAELWQDPLHARELAIEGHLQLIDSRTIAIVVFGRPLRTPSMVHVRGPAIDIAGEKSFWAGTNYYPSSSWWEWLWRDFRPLESDQDFAAMRRAGYRIVRIWIDPILDEQTMRAMDAAVYLAAQHGIVLDICLFTQWVRTIGFESPNGERVRFDFRGLRDFNVYGISFRNLKLQRAYVHTLAGRWRGVGNVIYNLSNETYVRDPDTSQMDQEAQAWPRIPRANGTVRNTALFQRWADMITAEIRKAGGHQPVLPGSLFSELGGGDSFLADRHGDIAAWHSYADPNHAAASLSYFDPACTNRPLILEEFGARGWNHADYYDAMAHAALASGAAAALSYEWGVRWLAREMSFYALPLRESLGQAPDPRWFAPALDIVKNWPATASGINPTPSGFFYGSIYSGTPFPAGAAFRLGRLGLAGINLDRASKSDAVYVVIPAASDSLGENIKRVTETIDKLRSRGVPFDIVQEECLPRLPASAKILVSPVPLHIKSAARRTWRNAYEDEDLPRLPIEPPGEVRVSARPTRGGTLYAFVSDQPATTHSVALRRHNVRFGIDRFGLVEERPAGIGLIEATGQVDIDGAALCLIENTRIILSAPENSSVTTSNQLTIVAYGPGRVRFARPVRSVAIMEAGRLAPVGHMDVHNNTLDIGDTTAAYALSVDFGADQSRK